MALNVANVTINVAALGISGTVGQLNRLSGALGTVARGAGGLAAGIGGALLGGVEAGAVALGGLGVLVGKTGTDFLGLQEQALTAFTTMLGSASKAQAFYATLQRFAATTPFELPGITESAQHLLAFGFQAKDIIPDLTAIGNAVSATGGGQAALDRVVLALGQMRAKGKVQGDEMLQLTENNISAWQYLADFLHTDIPTAMKMVTKGLVTGQQGIDAIIAGLSKDPKFAGMMEKQSHTFLGLLSNMHDYWNQFAAAVMTPLFDRALKPGLEWLTTWLAGPGQALGTRIGVALGDGLTRAGRAVAWLRGQFANFREVLGGGLGAGTVGGTLAAGFLLIRDSITTRVIPAVKLLWATFGRFVPSVNGMGLLQTIVLGVSRGIEGLARFFQLAVDSVVTFRQALAGDWFRNGSANAFVNTIGRIGLALGDLWRTFQAGGFGAVVGKLWTDYAQPALENLWTGLSTWVTGKIPLVQAQIGQWWGAFSGWATTMIPVVEAELGTLLTAAQAWIAGTGYPLLKTAAGNLWQALTGALTGGGGNVAMPTVGLTAGVEGQSVAAGGNFLTDQLNAAVSGALAWVAGPGAAMLGTLSQDIWTALGTKIGPALAGAAIAALGAHWEEILAALGSLIENTTIPGLVLKWAYPLGTQIGTAIYQGIADTPLGAFIRWLNGNTKGLGGGLAQGANATFQPGQNTGPGSTPLPGPAPSPAPSGNAPIINITMTGPTNEEFAQSMADHLYNAVSAFLAPGGGGVVTA